MISKENAVSCAYVTKRCKSLSLQDAKIKEQCPREVPAWKVVWSVQQRSQSSGNTSGINNLVTKHLLYRLIRPFTHANVYVQVLMIIQAQMMIRPAVASVFLRRGSQNPANNPATVWRPFKRESACHLWLFFKKNSQSQSHHSPLFLAHVGHR